MLLAVLVLSLPRLGAPTVVSSVEAGEKSVRVLDAHEHDLSLTTRLRQLHELKDSRDAALARAAAAEAHENNALEEATERALEVETGIAAMFSHSASSLSRFRGGSAVRLQSSATASAMGDDIVASETAKATAAIEADKKTKQAAAQAASRIRDAKQK